MPDGLVVPGCPLPHERTEGAARSGRGPVLLVCVGVALATVAVLLAVLSASGALTAAGRPGWTDLALPVVRLAGIMTAAGTIGTLLFAAVLSPPGHAAQARGAGRAWAVSWILVTGVGAVLTLADQSGLSWTSAARPRAQAFFVLEVDQGRAAFGVVVLLVVAVAAGGKKAGVRRTELALLCASLAVVPPAMTGHSAGQSLASASLVLHVLSSLVWIGGLAALCLYGRSPEVLPRAAAQFSAVALGCFVLVVLSGTVNAFLRVGAGALSFPPDSAYVWLLAAKLMAVVALGGLGWWHRARTVPHLATSDRAFVRLAGIELAVMLLTTTLAVALARTPTPI